MQEYRFVKQWRLLSEMIKQTSLINPNVREILHGMDAITSVNGLPYELLSRLSVTDDRVARLYQRYEDNVLGRYLRRYEEKRDDLFYNSHLEYYLGLDVRMLSLGATLIEAAPISIDKAKAVLPDGTLVVFNQDRETEVATLLDPNKWISRKQIKDRVYEVKVGNKRYILKEHKTRNHRDHIYSLEDIDTRNLISSAEEYRTAKSLYENGTRSVGNINLKWESVLGYVTTPRDFDFVIFDYEEGLIDEVNIIDELAMRIKQDPNHLVQEFNSISDVIPEVTGDPLEDFPIDSRAKSFVFANFMMEKEKKYFSEQFKRCQNGKVFDIHRLAQLKGFQLMLKARRLLYETSLELGFEDQDYQDCAYRILGESEIVLEVVGFDFEYYGKGAFVALEQSRYLNSQMIHQVNELFRYRKYLGNISKQDVAAYIAVILRENEENKKGGE